jgi:hypothetical protein
MPSLSNNKKENDSIRVKLLNKGPFYLLLFSAEAPSFAQYSIN